MKKFLQLPKPLFTIYMAGIFTLSASYLNAQIAPLWQVKANNKQRGLDMVSDKDGNIYVLGITAKSINDSLRIITTKYNSDGVELWSREHTMKPGTIVRGVGSPHMAVDQNGNIYIALPTSDNNNLQTIVSRTDIIKYNTSGIREWIRMVGDISFAFIEYTPISIDTKGNIYLIVETKFASSYTQNYLLKFDALGNKRWHAPLGTPSGSNYFYCEGLRLDSKGNAYSFGQLLNGKATYYKHDSLGVIKTSSTFQVPRVSTDVFDLEISSLGEVYTAGATLIPTSNTASYFVAKMNTEGDTVWTKTFKMNAGQYGYIGMKKDNLNSLFILTRKYDNILKETISELTKYLENGQIVWKKQIDPRQLDSPEIQLDRFQIDNEGNIYIATYEEKIYKYDNDGNYLWSTKTNLNTDNISIRKLILDHENNIIICDDNHFNNLNLAKYAGSITATEDSKNLYSANIYPNPVENALFIKLNASPITSTTIKISNSLGHEMTNGIITNQETSIDLSHFPQGIYFVFIKDSFKSFARKITKK